MQKRTVGVIRRFFRAPTQREKRVSRGPIGPSRGGGAGPLPAGGLRPQTEKATCVFRESTGFEKQLIQPHRMLSPLLQQATKKQSFATPPAFSLSRSRDSSLPEGAQGVHFLRLRLMANPPSSRRRLFHAHPPAFSITKIKFDPPLVMRQNRCIIPVNHHQSRAHRPRGRPHAR